MLICAAVNIQALSERLTACWESASALANEVTPSCTIAAKATVRRFGSESIVALTAAGKSTAPATEFKMQNP